MRNDIAGLFWDDTPPPKVTKEKVKRTPPERTWEHPDYLPNYERALAFKPAIMSPQELQVVVRQQHPMIYDVEVYPNFFMVTFADFTTGKMLVFELSDESQLDYGLLEYVFTHCYIVGFNSNHYDSYMVTMAIAGYSTQEMYDATFAIIVAEERPDDVMDALGLKRLDRNEVDLMPIAPLKASLKTYGARLHSPVLQDLPFPVGTVLTQPQRVIVRWYNIQGDITATAICFRELREQITLREKLGAKYGLDLRSKSDAQMAEAVIGAELRRRSGGRIKKPDIQPGSFFHLQHEPYLQFHTPLMKEVYAKVLQAPFIIGADGTVGTPQVLADMQVPIGKQIYRMGIGGLHSAEQKQVRHSDANGKLYDRDVASYYPKRILNLGMYPEQLGRDFLLVYNGIVVARLTAKEAGDIIAADSLKIVVNGTFGKTGSPWSIIYAPRMMVQVTVGGQLCVLMLIEMMELCGIEVISANTDGITCYVPNDRHAAYLELIKWWEQATQLKTEETQYRSMYSRDVNNYMAVKMDGKVKAKGAYLNAYDDSKLAIFRFHKNPVNIVCLQAVEAYLVKGTPLAHTVHACTDVRRFLTVRAVRGGAVKNGEYLGKTVRWYYGKGGAGEIIYASSGNKVPRSEGAVPCMELPAGLPADLDLDWYVREADDLLRDFGLPSTLMENDHVEA